ncbi:MAG TPA: hypothetical protein VNG90_02545 [Candidatus Acidoferrum sp.]|nr:hypothetical protein [Candidatus Acidoferrum sp.]
MDKKPHYTDVLLEDMNGKFDAIMEMLIPMREELNEVKKLTAEIPELKTDIKIIKAVLTDSGKQLQDHERRITRLETRLA